MGGDRATLLEIGYQGQTHKLTMRVGPDGYFSARDESAIQLIVMPFLAGSYAVGNEFYADEYRVCRVLNLIVTEAQSWGWNIENSDGTKTFLRFPWDAWYDIPLADIRKIVEGFFLHAEQKIRRLETSPTFMNLSLQDCVTFVSARLIPSTSKPSE